MFPCWIWTFWVTNSVNLNQNNVIIITLERLERRGEVSEVTAWEWSIYKRSVLYACKKTSQRSP